MRLPWGGRLRWQLTLSHLAAIACTLVSMIAAVVLIASHVIASQPDTGPREPVQDARNAAGVIAGMVAGGADPTELNAVLRALASGQLRATFSFGAENVRRGAPFEIGLRNVDYLVVLGPDGHEIGSSDPSGAAFSPPERADWQRALASGEVVTLDGPGPAALGAAPIVDDSGQTVGSVVVAKSSVSAPAGGTQLDLLRGLAIFGAASLVALIAASLFAVASSSLVAYLLSRSLVRRLERLQYAAAAIAAGDLTQRVQVDSGDELGQLGRQFNAMAADMERTLRELRAERDRVAGLLEQRRQLVANASHELRTPLATVRGYVESALARVDGVPRELRRDLEIIDREIERLQQLIEDLFAIAQTELGRLTLRLEPTNVGAVVQQVVSTSAPLAWRQRRVEVLAEVGSGLPPAIADRQRLEQVLSNLLSNALRHTPPGGLVAIAVAADDGLVRIEVRDTGEGIDAEDLPHVFERFFRGRNNAEVGAGLGLALVAELTHAMGGNVTAHSTPGEGSCFEVRLKTEG
ncbi:MAG: HAMP domain-containing histidine kinase [Chloroflexi bacterium]|nr:HAMP domain-containing histidine kinase [Chloroflexota bacterium]